MVQANDVHEASLERPVARSRLLTAAAVLSGFGGVLMLLAGILDVVGLVSGAGDVDLRATGSIDGQHATVAFGAVAAGTLDGASRAMFTAGSVLSSSATVSAYVGATALALALARGRQFASFGAGLAITVGAIMSFAGFAGAALSAGGRFQAAVTLGSPFVPEFSLQPGTWILGAAVIMSGLAFRAGHRLQRDTEGLV